MRHIKIIFFYIKITLLISIFLISCGPVPLHRTGAPLVDVNVAWKSSQTRSIATQDFTFSSEDNEKVFKTKAYTEALQLINNYYATLGARKKQLTPSKFKLVVFDIALVSSYNDEAIRLLGLNVGANLGDIE